MRAPAVAEIPAVEPVETTFRMRYGVLAILVGWFVTFLTFCAVCAVFVTVNSWTTDTAMGLGGFSFFVIAVIYGFVPALLIGLPVGALTGWPLRCLRNQWWHVGVHAVVTGILTMAIGLLFGGLQGAYGMAGFAAVAAFSAATGRASVIKLVTWRNAV